MTTLQETENFWAKVCFDPDYQPEGRYRTYRRLVTNRFLEVIRNICPIARDILQEEEWPILLWDYLRHSPPQSEIIRELPYEFSQYFKSNPFPLQDQYPYLGELIEYEYLEIMMRFAPEAEGKAVPGKLHLNPAHVLACYTWPVHYIRKDFCDPKKLPRGEYHLLLWRDPQSLEVKFMEVNALVASLIRALGAGARDSQDLLNSVAEQHGLALSQEFMAEGARLIQDMIDKKIIV